MSNNPYSFSEDSSNEYGYFFGSRLYDRPSIKDPIIDHILYEKDVICISSAPGVGKTMLALQMMCNLTTGTPFLGCYNIPRPMNVLYIQSEGDRSEILERLDSMRAHNVLDDTRWAHINIPGAKLNKDQDFQFFREMVGNHFMLYDVIIIDPLYTTVEGSLCMDDVATAWIRNIRTLKAEYDCAIIVLHHDAKDIYNEGVSVDRGNNISYGSVFWQAFFNHNFKLKIKQGVYTLDIGKSRNDKNIDKIEIVLQPEPLTFTFKDEELPTNNFVVLSTIDKSPVAITAREIMKQTGMPRATVYRVLGKLIKNKQILEDDVKRTTRYYTEKKEVPGAH